MSGRLISERFRGMGSDCSVALTAGPRDTRRARAALATARSLVADCERLLSRFRDDSDLSRINRGAGGWVAVAPSTVAAVRAALAAREATGGAFDPTVLPALVAAGYDRSYESLEPRPAAPAAAWRPGARVDVADDRVRVEAGTAIDLGGIAKGWSAELALEAMRDAWPGMPGGLVDLGGDVALGGLTPEGGPWRVAVADPRRPGGTLMTLVLEGGGVATSGRDRRRFGPGRRLHHLIDPATGAPAQRGPLAVTAVASGAARAEAMATLVAVGDGREAARRVASHADLGVIVVPDSGPPLVLGAIRLDRPPLPACTAGGAA